MHKIIIYSYTIATVTYLCQVIFVSYTVPHRVLNTIVWLTPDDVYRKMKREVDGEDEVAVRVRIPYPWPWTMAYTYTKGSIINLRCVNPFRKFAQFYPKQRTLIRTLAVCVMDTGTVMNKLCVVDAKTVFWSSNGIFHQVYCWRGIITNALSENSYRWLTDRPCLWMYFKFLTL